MGPPCGRTTVSNADPFDPRDKHPPAGHGPSARACSTLWALSAGMLAAYNARVGAVSTPYLSGVAVPAARRNPPPIVADCWRRALDGRGALFRPRAGRCRIGARRALCSPTDRRRIHRKMAATGGCGCERPAKWVQPHPIPVFSLFSAWHGETTMSVGRCLRALARQHRQ